jgi:hypothetical protein
MQEPMNAEQTKRRKSHIMMIAIVLLAIAVFSWGISYKLSLYNPAAHMSAAKLLSQRERPATFETTPPPADPLVNPVPVTLFVLAIATFLTELCFRKPDFLQKSVRHRLQLPKQPGQTFFFFRPPPFLS